MPMLSNAEEAERIFAALSDGGNIGHDKIREGTSLIRARRRKT